MIYDKKLKKEDASVVKSILICILVCILYWLTYEERSMDTYLVIELISCLFLASLIILPLFRCANHILEEKDSPYEYLFDYSMNNIFMEILSGIIIIYSGSQII